MICSFCGGEVTRVIATIKGFENIRLRQCKSCLRTFETIEKIAVKTRDWAEIVENEKYSKSTQPSEKLDLDF